MRPSRKARWKLINDLKPTMRKFVKTLTAAGVSLLAVGALSPHAGALSATPSSLPAAHAHGADSGRAEKAGLCRITEFERVDDEIGHYSAVLRDSGGPIQGQVVEFETDNSEIHLGSVESGPDGRAELDLRPKLDMSTDEGRTLYGELVHSGLWAHSTVPGKNIECSARRPA